MCNLRSYAPWYKTTSVFFFVVVAIYTYTNQELPEVALLFTMVCFEYASWYVSMNTGTIGHVSNLCVGSNTQITDTPYGTSVHAYADDTPFDDDDLYPIMIYMGFSNKDGTLLYTTPDDRDRHLGFCICHTTSLLNQVTDVFTSSILRSYLLTIHAHFTYITAYYFYIGNNTVYFITCVFIHRVHKNTDQDFFLFLLVKKLASDFMPVLSTFARDFCAAVSFVTCRTYSYK